MVGGWRRLEDGSVCIWCRSRRSWREGVSQLSRQPVIDDFGSVRPVLVEGTVFKGRFRGLAFIVGQGAGMRHGHPSLRVK